MKRLFLAILVLLGFGLLAAGYWLGPAAKPAGPNVVFLLLDALRADRIGATRNGLPVAPFLHAMSKQSVYFSNAITPCTWTKPAMASLFTSCYVDTHKVYWSEENEDPEHPTTNQLAETFETMAEFLAKHGYDTWAMQTNANLHPALGFAQGFRPDHYRYANGAPGEQVTTNALEALRSLRGPFFLYAHYMDPHAPYSAPEKYRGFFGPPPSLTPEEQDILEHRQMDYLLEQVNLVLGLQTAPRLPQLSPAGEEQMRCRYDEDVRSMDDQIARLVKAVRADHPNTLFVVLADHGEEFWERRGMGHGTTLYQEQAHVPFMIFGPGLAPREVPDRINTIDMLPTLAGLLHFAPNAAWQGHDLFAAPSQPIFSRTRGSWPRLGVDLEMVVEGNLKLIRDLPHNRLLLFDLAADPEEKNNLAGERPQDAARMAQLLDGHRARNLNHSAGAAVQQSVDLPPEIRQQQHDIGYKVK